MQLLSGVVLTLAVVFFARGEAVLRPGPCTAQGNPWKMHGRIEWRARIVSMVGEKAGHSPFNIFPNMHKDGNCIEVYFSNRDDRINFTMVCKAPSVEFANYYQCPWYEPDVRWLLGNLRYLQYDAHRFELSSCAKHNETHSYHGRLLLTENTETRGQAPNLPMWKAKLEEPGAVPFLYNSSCATCLYRNEYVALVPQQDDVLMGPVEPQPYCVNGNYKTLKTVGSTARSTKTNAFGTLPMVLLICIVLLVAGGLLLCVKKPDANTVTPVISLSDR